ncbi:hypothetical protein EC253486_4657 [Escherichia coli 2534-86]|nr:hypothetical protein EC253486_4657 [Escherichia coli 2534-86]EHW05845.1 hypothetical protein ECDEC8A_4385 [Escherichia coli DEC8A]EHW06377.1 hypothetical protein ECDEC8B_4664 [Escherichia coli DEC8B]EHW23665.1 hypothetical protein ECDEC8E_4608 [Escherichia coli DEC8E]
MMLAIPCYKRTNCIYFFASFLPIFSRRKIVELNIFHVDG